MTNKKTAAYCVLLAMLIFVGTVCASFGEAQARYCNTIVCSTVIETAKPEISSDILTGDSEAPVTVLLGKIAEEKTFAFSVNSSGAEVKEKISWKVDSEYVSVGMKTGETVLSSGGEIQFLKDEETEILMTVVPLEKSHGALTAKIEVSIGELSGTFEADIPAFEKTEQESAGSTDIAPEEPAEGSGAEEVPAVDTGSGGETGGATGESSGEISGSETAGTVDGPAAGLKTLSHFERKGKLPIKMILPKAVASVKIGFYENGELVPLPKGTKLSTDEGNKFYTVYGGGIAEFDISKFVITESGYSVLLDFENAEIGEAESVTVAAEAYSKDGKIGIYTVSSVPYILETGKTEIASEVEEMEMSEIADSETEEASYYILSAGDSLLTKFPKEWAGEAALDCSVQILSLAENELPVYTEVELSEESLWASYTVDEENCNLMLDIGKILPDAGTYQAYITWEFDGICFYRKQITFFIKYSTDIYSTLES